MGLREDILAFARSHTGSKKECAGQDDLLGVFGLDGDDASEFLEVYAARFGVDLAPMRWEFHYNADEPPYQRRVLPVGEDGNVIPWQPITLDDLVTAAEAGRWVWDYPEHQVRYASRAWIPVRFLVVLVSAYIAWDWFWSG